jgi:hypothetical protein
MNRDLLNEKLLNSLLNIIIGAEYAVDQNHMSEILVSAEYVWENMLEKELSCDLGKQAGRLHQLTTNS